MEQFLKKLFAGDHRALARALSIVESESEQASKLLEKVFPRTGKAHIVGITGSPGAGKSTLVDRLVGYAASQGKRAAILAVDPSSPFSGGAILGDRIRMVHAGDNAQVFIRSMATRGALGGLAPTTQHLALVLDAAGFDFIVIETVGVGQAEVEIVKTADTTCVVLVPGMGDAVQALKSGILEIADIYVINKSDYEGADRLEKEVRTLIRHDGWVQPIVRTVATKGEGNSGLFSAILKHREWAEGSGEQLVRRKQFLSELLLREVSQDLYRRFMEAKVSRAQMESGLERLMRREISPKEVALELVEGFLSVHGVDS